MSKHLTIAIDGPAGAGKSTIAKKLARHYSIIYVDTGAMYRTVALYMLRNELDTSNIEEVVPRLSEVNIELKYLDGEQHIFLNGEDVSETIRSQEVSENASKVSAHLPVRAKMVEMQKAMGQKMSLVMDGRDIGTHVLTDATVKVFLTADPQVRAKRRCDQLAEKGIISDVETIKNEIIERDYRDTHREHAPLRQADDARLVDTSRMSIDEVVQCIIQYVEAR